MMMSLLPRLWKRMKRAIRTTIHALLRLPGRLRLLNRNIRSLQNLVRIAQTLIRGATLQDLLTLGTTIEPRAQRYGDAVI